MYRLLYVWSYNFCSLVKFFLVIFNTRTYKITVNIVGEKYKNSKLIRFQVLGVTVRCTVGQSTLRSGQMKLCKVITVSEFN
jgi:hypothetical protein